MAATLSIRVLLRSGRQAFFEGIAPGAAHAATRDGVSLTVGAEFPAPVTVVPPAGDRIASVVYDLFTDIRNYHKPIIPDSGRWFIWQPHMVMFWRLNSESCINDVKTPLYLFTGQDLNVALAFGVIGRPYETGFKILEPRHNRALITYMRRLSMRIQRGTDLFPIPDSVAAARPDGAIVEHLYFRTGRDAPDRSWMLTLRDFAGHTKRLHGIPDVSTERALAPLWCSWTDWHSNDVTDAVTLRNVRAGLKLGIRNYIIDDGWFGPGLDNEWDVELNIGDWEPEPTRFPDLRRLVADIKREGAVPMIWCAPHAVAAGAQCFAERRRFLIADAKGELVKTTNGFHSLCFQCPDARRIMGDIAAGLAEKWGFEGAKYDLFNSVPYVRCANPDHAHDTHSMVEGLEWTLREMDERCRAIRPDYIVELKQNYGTPFLARYGSMTRAGDTPYNPEGNYLRTMHVQSYSPFSINDYQTITNEDSPVDAACVVIKMIAVGIPTYSIDFDRLNETNQRVIAHYNDWYNENVRAFMRYRLPLDAEGNVFRVDGGDRDFFLLVNHGGEIEIARSATVLNGTHRRVLFVRCRKSRSATVTQRDPLGREVATRTLRWRGWTALDVPPGGRLQIEMA
jgi:alpha-galactosidase